MLTAEYLATFHDAELVDLAIRRKAGELDLGFKLLDGTTRCLFFRGIVSFRVLDVIPQNVVSRLLLSDVHSLPDPELDHWLRWSVSLSDGACFGTDQTVAKHVAEIRSSRLRLFILEPSFGAEAAVICEGVYPGQRG